MTLINPLLDDIEDDPDDWGYPKLNSREESAECGCESCMAEWVIAEKYTEPQKEGFKLGELIVDDSEN